MNHHYIEFMTKERQREEREACERLRMLKAAHHSRAGLVQKAGGILAVLIRFAKEKLIFRKKRLDAHLSTASIVVQPEGKRI